MFCTNSEEQPNSGVRRTLSSDPNLDGNPEQDQTRGQMNAFI